MPPRVRTTDPVSVVGYVLFIAALVAPVAVGIGVVAARLAGPDATFVAALTATAAAGVLGGILAPSAVRRRARRHVGGAPPPRPRP